MRSCACWRESRNCSRSEYAVSSIGSRTIPFCSRVDIWLCTSATFFWNLRNISLVSIGWTNMEMSMTLSMLMMGANQPVVKKRGYEMTKKVRAIFSPRSSSRELTRNACGAMTSWRSRIPDLYISSGRTGSTLGLSTGFFFVNISNSAIRLFLERHRLCPFPPVEEAVEKLDGLLGAELHGAHAGTHKTLLHDCDPLFKLRDL